MGVFQNWLKSGIAFCSRENKRGQKSQQPNINKAFQFEVTFHQEVATGKICYERKIASQSGFALLRDACKAIISFGAHIENILDYLVVPSEKNQKGLQSYVFDLTFLQQHLFYQYPFSFPTGSSIFPSTGKVWQNCFGMEALFIICRDGKKRHAATGERHYLLTYEVARKKKL